MNARRIPAGDLEVSYFEAGEGPPLVLLHGGLATAEMSWGAAIPRLATRFHVLAPDSRGHGGTNNPSDRLGYDLMADDVAHFCSALGLATPVLVGYSDGGQVALEFGLRHPGKAAALVLGGTISQPTEAYLDGLRNWGFAGPAEVDLDRLAATFGGFFDTIKTVHGGGDRDYWRRFLPQVATLWHTAPRYTEAQLASITVPTLVISGDRDEMAGPAEAQRLWEALGDAELALVPGAGHDAVERAVFWDLVEDFLTRRG